MFDKAFVREDLKRYIDSREELRGVSFCWRLFLALGRSPVFFRIFALRNAQWAKRHGLPRCPFLNWVATVRTYNAIQINTLFVGKGLKIEHGNGIVIGAGAVIGDYATILHQVTVGNKTMDVVGRTQYPKIGDHVFIGAGAKVIGGITVGNHVTIGANAVVLEDVPDGCTAVGVPARIVRPGNNKT